MGADLRHLLADLSVENAAALLRRWEELRKYAASRDPCRDCCEVEDLQDEIDRLEQQYPTKEIR
jgi:hypothetical protein